jgi:hypothetical protein
VDGEADPVVVNGRINRNIAARIWAVRMRFMTIYPMGE